MVELDLRSNVFSDLEPLAGLAKLERLQLAGNEVVDISPLASLTSLEYLDLTYNSIADFSPLLVNEGLAAGDIVALENQRNVLVARNRARRYKRCLLATST